MDLYALNKVEFGYDAIDEAFPDVDPGIEPLGSRVLCQVRLPKRKTKGGIILTAEVKDTEQWNTQVAKVVAIGPVAFRNRTTLEAWPEGGWARPGDFVRVPKYGGDRWSVKHGEGDEADEVLFVIFDDLNLVGKVKDPLAVKAYL